MKILSGFPAQTPMQWHNTYQRLFEQYVEYKSTKDSRLKECIDAMNKIKKAINSLPSGEIKIK